jgi:hypothetical protein
MSDDQDYYCLICGGDDRLAPLELAQVGGGRTDWAHDHCYATLHLESAIQSLQEALRRLNRVKFDTRGALKCLARTRPELRAAKNCLTGKARG